MTNVLSNLNKTTILAIKTKLLRLHNTRVRQEKNGFERGKQHLRLLEKKDTKESVLWLHSLPAQPPGQGGYKLLDDSDRKF